MKIQARGDKHGIKRTGRHTFHALDTFILVNNRSLGHRVVVKRIRWTDFGARRRIGTMMANLSRKAEAIFVDPGFYRRGMFNFDTCPEWIDLSLGRVDERAGDFTDFAISA